jgi:transcriptional regulator with XRE-family HTH domain
VVATIELMPDDTGYFAVVRARIRAARIAQNLSQDEVANAAGLETRTYQHFENPIPSRKFNPRLETLLAVARAIGAELTELLRPVSAEDIQALEQPQAVRRLGRKRNVSRKSNIRQD